MDPNANGTPPHLAAYDRDALRHVHFVAIGGTGMGSLAGLLKARGLHVTGSDGKLYPPMSTALESWGIPVVEGFRPENALAERPDLVVIGNAVRRDNPEALAVMESGIPYRSFSDALYELAIDARAKHSIVVAGTHGKTTTTSIVAALLQTTGRDPSLLVGGISLDFDGSFREGQGDHFVVEGDEYDTAWFDKTPKFLHYHPKTLILTSVEFDHADIYRDLDHVKEAFRTLIERMPADGVILACGRDENVRDVVRGAPCPVRFYGASPEQGEGGLRNADYDWLALDLDASEEGTAFDVWGPGGRCTRATMRHTGRVNIENALGALAVLHELGVPLGESVAALPSYRGVRRRQELRGEAAGVSVIDDFAHHPTAVRETLAGLRARYPERRIVAVFEPRTNTSRRRIFQDDYARAFDDADVVAVLRVADEPIYSATGEVTELFSSDELVEALEARGRTARAFDSVPAIVERLGDDAREGDVVMTLSNGAFGGIWPLLLERLGGAPAV